MWPSTSCYGTRLTSSIRSLRPVYFFAFCDPHHHSHLAAFRSQIFEALLGRAKSGEDAEAVNLLCDLVGWMSFRNAIHQHIDRILTPTSILFAMLIKEVQYQ